MYNNNTKSLYDTRSIKVKTCSYSISEVLRSKYRCPFPFLEGETPQIDSNKFKFDKTIFIFDPIIYIFVEKFTSYTSFTFVLMWIAISI